MVRTSFFVAMACSLLAFCVGLKMNRFDGCRIGWNLVPVVVASVDISPGTVITFDHLSQRSVPEQFITSSVVKPDQAQKLIGQRAGAAMQAGDPLRWVDFPASTAQKLESARVAVAVELGAEVSEGDRLDLLLEDGTPLVENARAVSTGAKPWLEVTQAEAKSLARRRSGFMLVLRGSAAR